jgi:hypothetical protein
MFYGVLLSLLWWLVGVSRSKSTREKTIKIFVFTIICGLPYYVYLYDKYQFELMCEQNKFKFPEEMIKAEDIIFYDSFPEPLIKRELQKYNISYIVYPKSGGVHNLPDISGAELGYVSLNDEDLAVGGLDELSKRLKYGLFSEVETSGRYIKHKMNIYDIRKGLVVSRVEDVRFSRSSEDILFYLLPYGFKGCSENNTSLGLEELLKNTFVISESKNDQ